MRVIYFLILFSLLAFAASAHDASGKEKLSMKAFKDSLDGSLDLSDFLIHYNGFIRLAQLKRSQLWAEVAWM